MVKKPPIFPDDPRFIYLDEEERELIESIERAYERGEIKSLPPKQMKSELKKAKILARNTLRHIRKSK